MSTKLFPVRALDTLVEHFKNATRAFIAAQLSELQP